MRELKFRAWDSKDFNMVYMDKEEYGEDEYIWRVGIKYIFCYRIEWCQNTLGGEVNDTYEVSDDVLPLMQYTGLKDKNGVEIYEGDIVESNSHRPSLFKIDFIEGGFCAYQKNIEYPLDINHFYPSVGCQIKVIGNIYENPELLS